MASTVFKRDEVLILLGAGASIEAGIPDSASMVREIELGVGLTASPWVDYRPLYHYIRSSIYFADGLDGLFGDRVSFNIERLVNALDELRKKEKHPLYPFVGAWNPKLLEVAGRDFDQVRSFRTEIVKTLRETWVALEKSEEAAYYGGLTRFQQELEYPLRVFSLSYDLCVEKVCGDTNVQRGFDSRRWDWRLFNETSDDTASILLYKLHGSIDWRIENGRVTYSDAPSSILEDDLALIFGSTYKLQYVDPFLFLAYELRRWTLDEARVIVAIGYGFGDEHINGILQQSLRESSDRRLLAVVAPGTNEASDVARISSLLLAGADQVVVKASGAKKFLAEELTVENLAELFPAELDLIPELPSPKA